jgi:LPXTG-motif cell wall-anchored protein
MRLRLKVLLVSSAAAILAISLGGSALAQLGPGTGAADRATGGLIGPAINELGNTEHGPCVQQLLDLPALNSCRDAQGRVIMDLPGLTLVGPPSPAPRRAPVAGPHRALPRTGVNVGDLAAIGLAALAGGAVLLRRMRLAFA